MNSQLGLRENWQQFSLPVLVNASVAGMARLEGSVLPPLAEQEFHLVARSAILSFITVFGLTKVVANHSAGAWANKIERKNRLVVGRLFGLPVPVLWAPSWGWVLAANVLLGLNQGLAWSSTGLSALMVRWRMYCLPVIAPVVATRSGTCGQPKWEFTARVKKKAGLACVVRNKKAAGL